MSRFNFICLLILIFYFQSNLWSLSKSKKKIRRQRVHQDFHTKQPQQTKEAKQQREREKKTLWKELNSKLNNDEKMFSLFEIPFKKWNSYIYCFLFIIINNNNSQNQNQNKTKRPTTKINKKNF